mmetsp:Transcript_38468/g.105985  ORF Transcript_38468/g.105985 Transcript_38468/m.105985 type:complete len:152 (-) Transcript_38468:99-554(-)|eukprot:CAMPEP_0117517734 /NCGR_PEP_ID=MMETSP0784-20121206/31765_1 /TAXON_ID=39447 /ORGANISM="" /LENGTH=151 /DNA_ID=CAMNT_0005313625 /DNA_START=97 /DNA_END=552 /DNA_ORIENTATION=-
MTSRPVKQRTAASILEGLREAMEDDEFLMQVAQWAWQHCPKFPYEDPRHWEHPLEFTALHNDYRQLFENRADEFLDDETMNLSDVLDEIHRELEENPGPMRALVDSLAASEDYLAFCKYMQNIRMRRDWAEGKDLEEVDAQSEPSKLDTME